MAGAQELDDDFPLFNMDFTKSMFITAWGRKRSGKSVFNREIYRSFPGDKVCIDVNGNAEPGEDAEKVGEPVPTAFPSTAPGLGERRRPRNLHYRAHPASATFRDDLDRAVGLALYPQKHPTLLWAGECGELMPNGKAGPHMRLVLMQNRHYNVTALFDGPRPVYVNPLTLSQSDLVAVFPLPNPNDRKRIADEIGFPLGEFEKACQDTWRRGDHWFVLWDSNGQKLWACPPLPVDDTAAAA